MFGAQSLLVIDSYELISFKYAPEHSSRLIALVFDICRGNICYQLRRNRPSNSKQRWKLVTSKKGFEKSHSKASYNILSQQKFLGTMKIFFSKSMIPKLFNAHSLVNLAPEFTKIIKMKIQLQNLLFWYSNFWKIILPKTTLFFFKEKNVKNEFFQSAIRSK